MLKSVKSKLKVSLPHSTNNEDKTSMAHSPTSSVDSFPSSTVGKSPTGHLSRTLSNNLETPTSQPRSISSILSQLGRTISLTPKTSSESAQKDSISKSEDPEEDGDTEEVRALKRGRELLLLGKLEVERQLAEKERQLEVLAAELLKQFDLSEEFKQKAEALEAENATLLNPSVISGLSDMDTVKDRAMVGKLRERMKILEKETEDLQEFNRGLEMKVEELEAKLRAAVEAQDATLEKLRKEQEVVANLKSLQKETLEKLEGMESKALAHNTVNSTVEEEISSLQRTENMLKAKVSSLESELTNARQKFTELKERHLKNGTRAVDGEGIEEDGVAEKENGIECLRSNGDDASSLMKKYKAEMEFLSEQLSSSKIELEAKNRLSEIKAKECEELKKTNDALLKEMNEEKKRNETLTWNINALTLASKETRHLFENGESKRSKLEDELRTKAEELESIAKECLAAKNERDELKTQLWEWQNMGGGYFLQAIFPWCKCGQQKEPRLRVAQRSA